MTRLLLLSQRRYDEAIKVFQDVLPRAPTHPRLHWSLMVVPSKFHAHLLVLQSRVYLQLKRFNDAVAQAQRAVEHTPGHVSNHLTLAFAHLAAQQWHAAI